ncbi:hypothetical protein ACFFUE_08830 [Bergeyella porcorum]
MITFCLNIISIRQNKISMGQRWGTSYRNRSSDNSDKKSKR